MGRIPKGENLKIFPTGQAQWLTLINGNAMTIYIAADHNGFRLKNVLRNWLEEEGYEVVDEGPDKFDKNDDYPDYGIKVARAVAEKPDERRGILICGSGVGMSVVADKVRGVRAAFIHNEDIARAARRDDDINVLALGALYIDEMGAKKVVRVWLDEKFLEEERYIRRIKKIADYEREQEC